ncbi:amino acid permease C-terminal domain-containing protein [Lacticaseibacillus saniviri]
MSQLSLETWVMSGLWFGFGLIIYFSYGFRHSARV